MVDEELAFTPAAELIEMIVEKQVSPVELTELYFDRIDRLDSQLNSYLLLTRDEAMATAKAAEEAVVRGDELGPLHGLPISVKDTQMTAGVRTTHGSLIYKDRIPERDAAVVERVKGAGAIMLGKTNTPELGLVGACENMFGPPGANPWDTDRTPGGLQWRGRGRNGRVPLPPRDGRRRRRLDTDPRPLLRDIRHQAHPGEGVGLFRPCRRSDAEHILTAGPAHPHRPRLRPASPSDGRARSERSDHDARGASRLRGRAGQEHRGPAHRVESRLRLRRRPSRGARSDVEGGPRVRGDGMRYRGVGPLVGAALRRVRAAPGGATATRPPASTWRLTETS